MLASRALLYFGLSLTALSSGCVTSAWWAVELPQETHLDVQAADYQVQSLAVTERVDADARAGLVPSRELVVHAERRAGKLGAEASWMVAPDEQVRLRPFDDGAPDLVAGLLAGSPVGVVDRCELQLDWTSGADTEPHWTARLWLEGWLSPRLLRARVDAAAAGQLLQSPSLRAVADADAETAGLLACAVDVDWSLLCPGRKDCTAEVLGWFGGEAKAASGGPATGVVALLRVGEGRSASYLQVPAAALPMLAGVQRADTLLPRFCCERRFLPMFGGPTVPTADPLPLPVATGLRIASHQRYQFDDSWFAAVKVLLTPVALVADAAVEAAVSLFPGLRPPHPSDTPWPQGRHR